MHEDSVGQGCLTPLILKLTDSDAIRLDMVLHWGFKAALGGVAVGAKGMMKFPT